MDFVFDPAKEKSNIRKHGLDFSLAKAVFADQLARDMYDRFENGEHRYHLVGCAGPSSRLIKVSYAFPDPNDDQKVRIISVRKVTKSERKQYETTLK